MKTKILDSHGDFTGKWVWIALAVIGFILLVVGPMFDAYIY